MQTSFWNTAVGHAIVSALVTAAVAIVSTVVNDPSLSHTVLGGGIVVTIGKLVVDVLRSSVPNI